MNFQHWPMNLASGGGIAMTIDTQCDVFLVDDSNFASFKSGRDFRYYGGNQKLKQVRIRVPRSGHWHLVLVPMPGNTVRYSEPIIF